jgi:GntR family transcriptional regulator/MocR family aminotransferase
VNHKKKMVRLPDPFLMYKIDHFMRRSKGTFLPPVGSGRLRRGDLYRALRAAALEGVLTPGERLPSTRQAAADYGVSRGMVEQVFDQLSDEGFLERAVGRGTFVTSHLTKLVALAKARPKSPGLARVSQRGRLAAANASCREPVKLLPFNAGIADTTEFPWKAWCRLQARAARELGLAGLDFADPRGLPDLRAAIARYLAQFRGIRCTASQVIIFNSSQQALSALAILLLNPGDRVWIEDPCYRGARTTFELMNVATIAVPVDAEGICVDTGIRRATHARAAYVTPPDQYPTGAALSLERRIALLKWATRNNAWIVEDDYDGEFRYEGQPLATLYSLDSDARVLYLGTLNKSMFVSLRLAFVVVPENFTDLIGNIRTQMDGFTPPLTQLTMSLFMDEGYFSPHLRRMRAVYGAKRAAVVAGLDRLRAMGWTWSSNPAGMHLLIGHRNGDYVRAVAASSSLDLALLSSYRFSKRRDDGLFLRFGALDSDSLRTGIEALVSTASNVKIERFQ